MKNDGFVKHKDIMPYLFENLAYWGDEEICFVLEKMPVSIKGKITEKYIRKSDVIYFLRKYIYYWGSEEVEQLINRMPTINGILIYTILIIEKFFEIMEERYEV